MVLCDLFWVTQLLVAELEHKAKASASWAGRTALGSSGGGEGAGTSSLSLGALICKGKGSDQISDSQPCLLLSSTQRPWRFEFWTPGRWSSEAGQTLLEKETAITHASAPCSRGNLSRMLRSFIGEHQGRQTGTRRAHQKPASTVTAEHRFRKARWPKDVFTE